MSRGAATTAAYWQLLGQHSVPDVGPNQSVIKPPVSSYQALCGIFMERSVKIISRTLTNGGEFVTVGLGTRRFVKGVNVGT
jgi:hypothetical protein